MKPDVLVSLISAFQQTWVVNNHMFNLAYFQSEKFRAVLKIRAKVLDATRSWLNQNDYLEVQGPTIIPALEDCPGSFEVKYFDKKAYLAQGLKPYGRLFTANFGKVYTIAPAFRAEKAKTTRHLTEYWRIEIAQQCDLDDIIAVQEDLIDYICYTLSKELTKELKCLGRKEKDLAQVQKPFIKLTYDQAIDLLKEEGVNVTWGQKIDWEQESKLSHQFHQPFFIKEYPLNGETFFYKEHPEQSELTLSFDLLAPDGYGEIAGGGQRIDDKRILLQKMNEENIAPEYQKWYVNFMQKRVSPISGFALGLERLLQWICNLTHIDETTAISRTVDKIYP